MLDSAHLHPLAAFWLDVADKLLKLAAVLIGAAWTWMHYHHSRTYAPKLELHLEGNAFRKGRLYMETVMALKNLGAARYVLQQRGATCEVAAIHVDGSERILRFARVLDRKPAMEPGETIRDLLYFEVASGSTEIVWIRVSLRVIGSEVEWNESILIKVN